jgi:hypothetical protein
MDWTQRADVNNPDTTVVKLGATNLYVTTGLELLPVPHGDGIAETAEGDPCVWA